MVSTPKITPFLWFDDQAVAAARFYVSIFKNSSVESDADDDDDASATSVTFWLDGQRFIAFNGGPHFAFSAATSFFVRCETQAEVDEFWDKLSAGGEQMRCGWLKDRFGVTWQVVPSVLMDLLDDEDEAVADRVRTAMLAMQKLDIAALQAAAAGGS